MLIVEGSDLTGKTTLCKRLTEELRAEGYVYKHLSRLPDNFDRYWGYRDIASLRIVQDRFHMSESVYARARGDKTQLGPEQYRLVDGMLRGMGAFTVIITCKLNCMFDDRWREGEMYDVATVKNVNDYFTEIVGGRFSPYSQMDYDYVIVESPEHPFPTEQDVHNILKCYKHRQTITKAVANSPYKPYSL